MENGDNVIVVNPYDIDQLGNILESVLKRPDYRRKIGQRAYMASREIEKFDEYIESTIEMYLGLIKK